MDMDMGMDDVADYDYDPAIIDWLINSFILCYWYDLAMAIPRAACQESD